MAVIPETAPAPASGAPRWRRFLTPWRSPADQPAWARPALLAIAAVAAAGYGRGMAGASVEPFYGATARSMSGSWHDFIFAAFDPAGTVTVDKLPGALWVQALSLRIFGFHIWALVLPQVAEGVLTVLVLYRAVRRLDGPCGRPDRRGRARRHAHHRAAGPRQRGREVLPIGRLPRQRAGPDAGHAAGRHQPRLRAGIRAAGVTARARHPRVRWIELALRQAAPAPAPPPGPVRDLLLRTPHRPAGRQASAPRRHRRRRPAERSGWSTYRRVCGTAPSVRSDAHLVASPVTEGLRGQDDRRRPRHALARWPGTVGRTRQRTDGQGFAG